MNDEGKRDSRRMRWLADGFVRPLSDVVGAHLARAQAEGLIAPVPLVSLHYIVLGAAGLIFSQAPECRYLAGVDPTDPAFAERHAEAMLELIIGDRLRARAPQRARTRSAPRRRGARAR